MGGNREEEGGGGGGEVERGGVYGERVHETVQVKASAHRTEQRGVLQSPTW